MDRVQQNPAERILLLFPLFLLLLFCACLQVDCTSAGLSGWGAISTGQQLSVHGRVGGASSIVSAKPGGLFVHFFVCFLSWALGAETLSSCGKLLSHLFVDCEPLIVS